MARPYYFEEIPHGDKKKRTLHKVMLPEHNEKKGYTSILSLEAFRHGRRKGASPDDKLTNRDGCNWGPNSLFIGRDDEDMDMSFDGTLRASQTIARLEKEKFPSKEPKPSFIEETYGVDVTRWQDIPTRDHEGIQAFYNHIGFDPKLRGYPDEKGALKKYSIIKMTDEQREKFKAAVAKPIKHKSPEME